MKERRLKLIAETVAENAVKNQADLIALLKRRGFAVTQASVSRDLDELNITKKEGVYRQSSKNRFNDSFGRVTFSAAGGHMIVAKCSSGLASALAVQLDALELEGVVGTIAGDDTVFVALASSSSQTGIIRKLKVQFGT